MLLKLFQIDMQIFIRIMKYRRFYMIYYIANHSLFLNYLEFLSIKNSLDKRYSNVIL